MKSSKKILKMIAFLLVLPVLYFLVSFITMSITVNDDESQAEKSKVVYLNSNGVHLDVVIPQEDLGPELAHSLIYFEDEKYISFGWGDENFYINTPTWGDLTFKVAVKAMFLKSTTLMHVTRYKNVQEDWTKVTLTAGQLSTLKTYIMGSFKLDSEAEKIFLPNDSYALNDNFYKAVGSYSLFKTCNSWVNTGFKKSGLKACYWTPFDFGLINKYKE